MDTLKLSELVGQTILELRFHYVQENEYGLQSFHSYIKLSSTAIINIPVFDNDDYLILSQENLVYFIERFETGQSISDKVQTYLVGQTIIDFYFSYYNGEIDIDYPAFIKLSNNYYVTERNYGPIGLNVDLRILNESQFQEEVNRRNGINTEVRSFNQT